jgi:chorismate dehydratase
MIRPVRLGAVSYLNVRPLIYGLERHANLVTVRYDVPSTCTRLLAAGSIDLGMIPSVALQPDHRIVPGVCIASDGPVASVALFSRRPIREVRSIALDTSSETSAALTRILCARAFDIQPRFVPHPPDLTSMLAQADAALLIGDAALFADPGPHGAEKIDLGQAWRDMTGVPFVWAFWAGRPEAADEEIVDLLQQAAGAGMAATDLIADAYSHDQPERLEVARRYLREHLAFRLDAAALEGLRRYYREAAALGLIGAPPDLWFFPAGQAVRRRPVE